MVRAIKVAEEGEVITKRKIQVVRRKFITKKQVKVVKKRVIKKLGIVKMKKMGKERVLKEVDKEIKKDAIRELKELGYHSACRGACGRKMKEVKEKVIHEREVNIKKIEKLEKFKKIVTIKQLKAYGIIVHACISKSYYDEKITFLNS